MQIIPVLDVSRGLVVHAKKGDRKNYLPINSHLCPTSNPIEIIKCFLSLNAFKSIYIADLDALQHQSENVDIIESICTVYPKLEIWLDTGLSLIKHYLENPKFDSLRMILSSESIDSKSTFNSLMNNFAHHSFIFSIDYKSGAILGPRDLLLAKEQWPTDILILNLDHVGAKDGINIPPQLNYQDLFQAHNTYYGGGIRNCNDLYKLKKLGAAGALLSTALHNKTITRSDLLSFSQ